MASSEVSWQSAFWSLPPLAINTMMQDSGRVCGFDPALRTYLRSSPVICVLDATLTLIRFTLYLLSGNDDSVKVLERIGIAAKKVMEANKLVKVVEKDKEVEEAKKLGIQQLEDSKPIRYMWFAIGVLPQALKLMACTGLPWTQAWGCFYLSSFLVREILDGLTNLTDKERFIDEELSRPWLELFERGCGSIAVLLQLGILALVDLAGIPPHRVLLRRWEFRAIRFSAHFITVFIYLPFVLSFSSSSSPPSSSTSPTPRPWLSPNGRNISLVVSMLLINIILTILHGLNFRFSHLYFLWSIIICMVAWVMFFITPAREHILLVNRGGDGQVGRGVYMNVMAFDFFCRILTFSVFWYVSYYKPAGTYKPGWADYLG